MWAPMVFARDPSPSSSISPLRRLSPASQEAAYFAYLYDNAHTQMRACVLIALLMTVIMIALDDYYVPSGQVLVVQILRGVAAIPLFFCLFRLQSPTQLRGLFAAVGLLLMVHAALSVWVTPEGQAAGIAFFHLNTLLITLLSYVLFRIQFRFGVLLCVPAFALLLSSVLFQAEFSGVNEFVVAFVTATILLTLLAAMYSRELAEREQFLQDASRVNTLEQQMLADRERARWYQMFGRMLRHELANSLVGIRTSFELIARFPEERVDYLQRGEKSLGDVQSLLKLAGEATNISEALLLDEKEQFDLVDVLRDCVEEFEWQVAFEDLSVPRSGIAGADADDMSAVEALLLNGQAYRMRQAINYLLDYVVEAGTSSDDKSMMDKSVAIAFDSSQTRMRVTLRPAQAAVAQFTAQVDVFDAWLSGSVAAINRRRGMTLYIARKIIEAHEGSIKAFRPPVMESQHDSQIQSTNLTNEIVFVMEFARI